MILLDPVGKPPLIPKAAGFVARDAEEDVARYLLRPMLIADREIVLLAGFDAYARLIGLESAVGDTTGRCIIAPQCWNRLLGRRVATVLMAHNHPSGIAQPSDADMRCTREAVQFLRLIGIDLSDHLIFVESGHFSFRNAGLL
ncbi:JAB domain-containing protein [Sphingopyxis sp.]|uniref:JAB domain-containing protein n=1 Tax=Sphingopyxis sp. TaxID=1908224 RepID=UPI003D147C91